MALVRYQPWQFQACLAQLEQGKAEDSRVCRCRQQQVWQMMTLLKHQVVAYL